MPKLLVAEQKCYAIAEAASTGLPFVWGKATFPICLECSGTGLKANYVRKFGLVYAPICDRCHGAGYLKPGKKILP